MASLRVNPKLVYSLSNVGQIYREIHIWIAKLQPAVLKLTLQGKN